MHSGRKRLILVMLFSLILGMNQPVHAQDLTAMRTFAWRSAGLIMQYPADWVQGDYQGNPLLVSTADGLDKASKGDVPGVPALTFLHYPQVGTISPTDLLLLIFPDQTTSPMVVGGVSGIVAQFEDTATGQTVEAVAFKSPSINQAHLVVAVAPTETWAEFEPRLQVMLSSIQFLSETASLEFAGGTVAFDYPDDWHTAANGQVVVASSEQPKAEAILEGDLKDAPPFIRAQLLVPSGIGIDPADAQAPRQILESFTGQTLSNITEFEWGDGLPAALTQIEVEGISLLLVAVVNGDSALLMGGGATIEAWPTARVWIDGALNLTVYNEQIAPLTLEDFIAGDTNGPFGMAQ
ncbi:MAG: hypothetical protein HY862_06230 [Chloroflexi bacterium]|nr:hypothetical protein [Chloroflexota bacterium]